jgi:GNAT superfamily N-acetyltransferase
MKMREFDPERDLEDVARIWREVGWLPSHERAKAALELYLQGANALVSELDGHAECMVATLSGDLRFGQSRLKHCALSAVTTSLVARQRGIATRLAARALANAADRGASVAGLGMFEKGFYDRLGFGSLGPTIYLDVSPDQLAVPRLTRPPKRLTHKMWRDVHANRQERTRRHGSVSIHEPEATAEAMWMYETGFGLGYYDGPDGALSHHVWLVQEGDSIDEHGPLEVLWLAYSTTDQLRELMSVLHSLQDQIYLLQIPMPEGLLLSDLVRLPMSREDTSKGGKYSSGLRARHLYQVRILDLQGCIGALPVHRDRPISFRLDISDPVEAILGAGEGWRGLSGTYGVRLGEQAAVVEPDPKWPTLKASVGAFSRWWAGVAPATSLAITDAFDAPEELLQSLDEVVLPRVDFDWDI